MTHSHSGRQTAPMATMGTRRKANRTVVIVIRKEIVKDPDKEMTDNLQRITLAANLPSLPTSTRKNNHGRTATNMEEDKNGQERRRQSSPVQLSVSYVEVLDMGKKNVCPESIKLTPYRDLTCLLLTSDVEK